MTAVTSLLLFLAVTVLLAVAQLTGTLGDKETLAAAGEAVGAVLATASHPQCFLILLTDGNTSATTVYTEYGQLQTPWGVAVLEVTANEPDATLMQSRVSHVVNEARKLRQMSWCVTVVVVSDDPAFLATFAQWSLKGRLLVWSMRLLALTSLPLLDLLNHYKIFSMTNTMLLIVDGAPGSIRCSVYVCLPYSPPGAQAIQIALWKPQRGLSLTTHFPLFPDKFSRLYHGPTMVVAAEEFEPHIALVEEEDVVFPVTSFTGPMVDVLDILANTMNFTYRYVRPPDGAWGVKRDDGSWTGMVGMVGRGEADFGLGPFGVSATRAEMVDFTRPILTENARILGRRGRPEVDPWGFLLPLAPLVWVAILTALLLVPAVVFLMSTWFGLKISKSLLSSSIFSFTRVLLQQDIPVLPDLWWERLVLASWMIMTLVLTRSYAGNLMSNLAVRYIPQPYQTLREVLDDPSVTMIWETNNAYVQYFRSVTSGIFREVADSEKKERIRYVRSTEFFSSMDLLVRQGDHVLIAENRYETVLRAQDFSLTGRCDFYVSREMFLPFMSSMVGPIDSPLVPVISERLKWVTQTGLYDHWTEAFVPNSTSCAFAPSKVAVNTSLSITNLWGMFVLLSGGLVVSLIVLGLEFLSAGLLLLWNSSAHDVISD